MSCPRTLADAESARLAAALKVVRLLATVGFRLAPFLRVVTVNSPCLKLLLGGFAVGLW